MPQGQSGKGPEQHPLHQDTGPRPATPSPPTRQALVASLSVALLHVMPQGLAPVQFCSFIPLEGMYHIMETLLPKRCHTHSVNLGTWQWQPLSCLQEVGLALPLRRWQAPSRCSGTWRVPPPLPH
jgi:hypothetical protein